MRKKLILCLVAACGLMFAGCKHNPAEDYEGTYRVKITPSLALNTPPPLLTTILNQEIINAATASVADSTYSCTVVLDGDDGDVKVIMLGNAYKGHVDDNGLQLDPMKYTIDYGMAQIVLTFTHSKIARAPDNADIAVLDWSASTSGDITIASQTLSKCLIGTTQFLATKTKG